MSDGSDTADEWVIRLRAGDPVAVRDLWDKYFDRMVALAREKLRGLSGRASDEEDVALSAFKSFCRAVEGGRCDEALSPDGLWALMMTLTARKAINLWRYETRDKRRRPTSDQGVNQQLLKKVVGREPEPEFIALMADECDRLFRRLDDPELKAIALCKLEGLTNAEIAKQLDLTHRTVQRKVRLIRNRLEDDA
jgi:DNA-directed RNA polymerase specialized sigma24 family protein